MIRKAKIGDRNWLCKIKPYLTTQEIEKRISRQDQGKAEFLVAEVNNEIVGFLYVKWFGKKTHPDYPDIEDLYVGVQFRGKGVGAFLLKEAEKKAREKGFTKIGLAVSPELNNKVKVWYEKLGYRHDDKPAYVDGVYNGVEDWVVDMEKKLV